MHWNLNIKTSHSRALMPKLNFHYLILLYVTGRVLDIRTSPPTTIEEKVETKMAVVRRAYCGGFMYYVFEQETMVCAENVTQGRDDACGVLSLFYTLFNSLNVLMAVDIKIIILLYIFTIDNKTYH